MAQNETKVIGLTGNSGSGKSTVAKILKEAGALIVNADSVAYEIMLPGSAAYKEVALAFDDIVAPNGRIDRKKLAALVFADPESKAKLDEITLPYIVSSMLRQVNHVLSLGSGHYPYIVLDAPLLFESGLQTHVHEVWVVTADEQTRLVRIMRRDSLSEEEALARLRAQTPEKTLINLADVVIENNYENIAELTDKIHNLLKDEV